MTLKEGVKRAPAALLKEGVPRLHQLKRTLEQKAEMKAKRREVARRAAERREAARAATTAAEGHARDRAQLLAGRSRRASTR